MAKKVKGMEYQMTKQMFDNLLKTRSEIEKKLNPYDFVMQVVNREFGVKGTVTHITVSE